MGSKRLGKQLDRLQPDVHVFGHSHIDVDDLINSTRFLQNALGQSTDAASLADKQPLMIWDLDWNPRKFK